MWELHNAKGVTRPRTISSASTVSWWQPSRQIFMITFSHRSDKQSSLELHRHKHTCEQPKPNGRLMAYPKHENTDTLQMHCQHAQLFHWDPAAAGRVIWICRLYRQNRANRRTVPSVVAALVVEIIWAVLSGVDVLTKKVEHNHLSIQLEHVGMDLMSFAPWLLSIWGQNMQEHASFLNDLTIIKINKSRQKLKLFYF